MAEKFYRDYEAEYGVNTNTADRKAFENILSTASSTRNNTAELNQAYIRNQISEQEFIRRLTGGTSGAGPVFDPTKGPQINTGSGFQDMSSPIIAAKVSPELGGGFSTTQSTINQASADIQKIATQIQNPAPIANPVPAPAVGTSPTAPNLPTPTAPTVTSSYQTGATATGDTQRTAVEDAYKRQLETANNAVKLAEQKIASIESKQEGVLGDVETLSQPFREELEKAQREALYITKNFEDNQKLINELDGLLTEGNELIKQQKEVTGLSAIRNPIINKTISDVNARAGVIQAVISARNNQIGQAEQMIDRTVSAMTADRRDQLAYYSTLYDFYGGKKDDAGKELITANTEKRNAVLAQIELLENDLKRTQTNADNLKKAMADPDTALAYAQAGVTLNDTPEQIATKLAKYALQKEVSDTSKDMAQKGYTALLSGTAPAGSEKVTITDSSGVTRTWYKKASGTGSGVSTNPLSILDIQRYQELYPTAGVVAGDTEATANSKVAKLNAPETVQSTNLKDLITKGKDGGISYGTLVDEIKGDNTIQDKDAALSLAAEIYGQPKSTLPAPSLSIPISSSPAITNAVSTSSSSSGGGALDSIYNFLFK